MRVGARQPARASFASARSELVRVRRSRGAGVERGDRVRQHRRVRLPVAGAADAHERLRHHVVQPVPGGVDRVAATAARRARAASRSDVLDVAGVGGVDQPRRLARGERRDRAGAASCTGASTAWASEFAALAASSAGGCDAHSAGSLSTIAGRTRCASAARPRACGGPSSSRPRSASSGSRRRRRPGRAADRLGRVDDAPAAERDDHARRRRPSRSSSALSSSTSPGPTWCTAAAALDDARAHHPARARSSAARSRRGSSSGASAIRPRPKWIVRSPSCQVKPLTGGTLRHLGLTLSSLFVLRRSGEPRAMTIHATDSPGKRRWPRGYRGRSRVAVAGVGLLLIGSPFLEDRTRWPGQLPGSARALDPGLQIELITIARGATRVSRYGAEGPAAGRWSGVRT